MEYFNSGQRDTISNYIKEKRNNGKFTVIDVGGAMNGWSSSFIDALVDFNDPTEKNISYLHFKLDITHPDSWKELVSYVEKNGKFDFSICSHTLEDIINPGFVCEMLQKISNSGFIAVPSIHRELSRCESKWKGYIHHRWFFTFENGIFTAYPKINLIEHIDTSSVESLDEKYYELTFIWNGKIPFQYINNNYLGPCVEAVVEMYKNVFINNKLR